MIQKAVIDTLMMGALVFSAPLAFAQSEATTSADRDGIRACVLSYETEKAEISQKLLEKFGDDSETRVVVEARPIDIVNCVRDGAETIVVIAHALELRPNFTSLGYFTRLSGDAREKFRQMMVKAGHDELARKPTKKTEKALRFFEVDALDVNIPLYDQARPILPALFDSVVTAYPSSQLKKLVLVDCDFKKVVRQYPQINELSNRGLEVVSQKANWWASLVSGHQAVIPNLNWISRQLNRD